MNQSVEVGINFTFTPFNSSLACANAEFAQIFAAAWKLAIYPNALNIGNNTAEIIPTVPNLLRKDFQGGCNFFQLFFELNLTPEGLDALLSGNSYVSAFYGSGTAGPSLIFRVISAAATGSGSAAIISGWLSNLFNVENLTPINADPNSMVYVNPTF